MTFGLQNKGHMRSHTTVMPLTSIQAGRRPQYCTHHEWAIAGLPNAPAWDENRISTGFTAPAFETAGHPNIYGIKALPSDSLNALEKLFPLQLRLDGGSGGKKAYRVDTKKCMPARPSHSYRKGFMQRTFTSLSNAERAALEARDKTQLNPELEADARLTKKFSMSNRNDILGEELGGKANAAKHKYVKGTVPFEADDLIATEVSYAKEALNMSNSPLKKTNSAGDMTNPTGRVMRATVDGRPAAFLNKGKGEGDVMVSPRLNNPAAYRKSKAHYENMENLPFVDHTTPTDDHGRSLEHLSTRTYPYAPAHDQYRSTSRLSRTQKHSKDQASMSWDVHCRIKLQEEEEAKKQRKPMPQVLDDEENVWRPQASVVSASHWQRRLFMQSLKKGKLGTRNASVPANMTQTVPVSFFPGKDIGSCDEGCGEVGNNAGNAPGTKDSNGKLCDDVDTLNCMGSQVPNQNVVNPFGPKKKYNAKSLPEKCELYPMSERSQLQLVDPKLAKTQMTMKTGDMGKVLDFTNNRRAPAPGTNPNGSSNPNLCNSLAEQDSLSTIHKKYKNDAIELQGTFADRLTGKHGWNLRHTSRDPRVRIHAKHELKKAYCIQNFVVEKMDAERQKGPNKDKPDPECKNALGEVELRKCLENNARKLQLMKPTPAQALGMSDGIVLM